MEHREPRISGEYLVTRDGATWTLTGATERATIPLNGYGRAQNRHWEFTPNGEWITLCDRVAPAATDPPGVPTADASASGRPLNRVHSSDIDHAAPRDPPHRAKSQPLRPRPS